MANVLYFMEKPEPYITLLYDDGMKAYQQNHLNQPEERRFSIVTNVSKT